MDKPKILDQVRDAIRVKHYSMRTEEAYVHWIKRFILLHLQKNIQMLKENLPGNIFPASNRSIDPRSGIERRHHIYETVLQKAVKAAVRAAEVSKPASCHTFRHSFATHLLFLGLPGCLSENSWRV